MKLLKLIAVPLVLFSIIKGVSNLSVFLSWVKWEQKQFYYT